LLEDSKDAAAEQRADGSSSDDDPALTIVEDIARTATRSTIWGIAYGAGERLEYHVQHRMRSDCHVRTMYWLERQQCHPLIGMTLLVTRRCCAMTPRDTPRTLSILVRNGRRYLAWLTSTVPNGELRANFGPEPRGFSSRTALPGRLNDGRSDRPGRPCS
jgi:hypothetical protein